MLSYPVFSKLTFNFGISTTYEKHLFVWMMSLNPSDIAPISNILSQIISIFFLLFGFLKYNLLSRFKKTSKQRYRIVLAIAAFNISMIRKNLVMLFFPNYNPTCYAT